MLLRWRLGRVGMGMVLMRVIAPMLQWGRVHGQHGGRPVAFSPSLLSPWRGTPIWARGVQRRGASYSRGALGWSLLLLGLGLLGRRLRRRRWRRLLLL